MSQTASLTGSPLVDSCLLTGGAAFGSVVATITSNNLAAITTLVATVGTLLYQFCRVVLENRRKTYEALCLVRVREVEAATALRVAEAHAARDAAAVEAAGTRAQLVSAEAEKLRLQDMLAKLVDTEANYRDTAMAIDQFLSRPGEGAAR
jgi:hypothetical protein